MATIEDEIRDLERQEAAAFLAGDADRLGRLWDEGLIVNAPHGRIMADAAPTLTLVQSGRLRHDAIVRHVESIRIHGDVAISMGSEQVQDSAGPMAGPPHLRRYTNVWKQAGGRWRLIARHASLVSA